MVSLQKDVVEMCCSAMVTIRSHHFVYIVPALLAAKYYCSRKVNK